jgi:hypothetical protein
VSGSPASIRWPVSLTLRQHQLHLGRRREGKNAVAIRVPCDHVERVRADRPGGPQHSDIL